MSEAVEGFCRQLRDLGYEPEVVQATEPSAPPFVVFDYAVTVGKHRGDSVRIALQIAGDWPANPPSGPFVSPQLLPIHPNSGKGRPWDSVHEAHGRGFPTEAGHWEYWSRPYPASPGWASTDRDVATYLRHILTLFGEIQ